MEPSIEITPELLAGFIDEADEYLGTLSELLMQFEDEAAAGPISFTEGEKLDQMNEMFRAAHSLKGLSGAFGFSEMNSLNHRMETLFDEAKMGKRSLDSRALESLLTAQGVIQEQVEELKSPTGAEIDVTEAMEQLQAILDATGSAAAEEAPSDSSAQIDTSDGEVCEDPTAQLDSATQIVPASVLDDPELRAIFIQSTEEDVEELSQVLLKIEEAVDEEITTVAFRIAHTIKGSCGAAGLTDAHDLTHRMETLLEQMCAGELSVSDQLMGTLLAVADRLREVVEEVKGDCYSAWPPEKVEELFAAWAPSGAGSTDSSAVNADSSASSSGDDDFDIPADFLTGKQQGLLVRVDFDLDNPESALQPFLIHNKLNDLGVVARSQPDMDKDTGEEPIATLQSLVAVEQATEESAQQLQALLSTFEVLSATVTVVGATCDSAEAPRSEPAISADTQVHQPVEQAAPASAQSKGATAETAETASPRKPTGAAKAPAVQETIRVDVDRLDQLMNLGGELVINRSQFSQIERTLKDVFEGKDHSVAADDIAHRLQHLADHVRELNEKHDGIGKTVEDLLEGICQGYEPVRQSIAHFKDQRSVLHSLSEAVNTLGRVSDTMQKQIMGTRMVPVGPLFSRFKRVIRDIAKNLGKKIEYQIEGEHTELDKKMIDELGDPLTHMIRNCVDHGIETPDERTAAGKNPTGTVKIEAYHQGNSICIRLSDDGKGIDVEAIRMKIVEKSVVSEAQASQLTDKELVQYIFHPGMSTAKVVSDVSGRGMGMDIVISKITNLNGTVEVESVSGQGTTVTIKLPLTLAIITSLLSRIGGEVYAIPLDAVAEIVTVNQANTNSVQGKKVVTVRGRVIPIFMLEQLLDMESINVKTRTQDNEEWTLVILGTGTNRMALVVDELLGQEDIVIKSLADNYENIPGFVGATIMGDGRVALILDPTYLQDDSKRQAGSAELKKKEVPA
ncbi:MAG: chemotaxis protein CheA [Planctomycetes bacterium]|nr:chemotaxis protein CheA [Planctomycetota bacterium]